MSRTEAVPTGGEGWHTRKPGARRSLFRILLLCLAVLPLSAYTITVMVKAGWSEDIYKPVRTETCYIEYDNRRGRTETCNTSIEYVYVETVDHPPEYDVYTVPAGTSPQDIEKMIDDLTHGTPLDGKVTITEDAPTKIDGGVIRSNNTVKNLEDLRNEIQNDITEAEAFNDQLTATDNSVAGGDPVLLATGDFVTSSTDAAFSMG